MKKRNFQIPENITELRLEALQAFVDRTVTRLREVAADPMSFTNDVEGDEKFSIDDVKTEAQAAVEAVKEARAEIARLEAETDEPVEGEEAGDGADGEGAEGTEGEGTEAEGAEGTDGDGADGDGAGEGDGEPSADLTADLEALAAEAEVEIEPITAAATPKPARRPPARSRQARPVEEPRELAALTASANVDGMREGAPFGDPLDIARAMIDKRRRFGNVAEGSEENVAIARAVWSYPDDRHLTLDEEHNVGLVAAVINEAEIRRNFEARRKDAENGALVASGGLCAPVTPYYNLQMVSVAERPVRAALPAFNADRGGIRYARPATLASITTGVGSMTVDEDAAGGTAGTKSCQVVDCPPFQETDIAILYHCLRFGNVGARTFPERVAQWNQLVLAAHARLAERNLLTGIDTASTQVDAHAIASGASGELLSQALTAAAGMRSRHRMAPDAVLRALYPRWVLDLVVSDVYRSTFGRWDMTPEKFVALLRQGGIEPSFYIDSAAGKGQEFGAQTSAATCTSDAGAPYALLPFPFEVTWYLFPEGTFLFIDGGTLELGLVRDSVLNSTNDYEIFGESFENVAFIGVESLAITSHVADIGVTAGTTAPESGITGPIDYCDPFVMKG